MSEDLNQNQPEVPAENNSEGQTNTGFSAEKVASMAKSLGEDLFGKLETEENSDKTSENKSSDENTTDKSDSDNDSDKINSEDPAKKADDTSGSLDKTKDAESTTIPAPKTWRTEAITEWDKLPPVIKAEVMKREEDFHRGIESYKEYANVGRQMLEIYTPHMELLTAHQVNPYQLASGLLNAHIKLSLKATPQAEKEQMFLKMASDYGVDLNTLDTQYKHEEDPSVSALRQEVETLKSQQIEQTKLSIKQQIEAFASDPANIYFDDVANDMTMLIRGGAKSLKEAYDKAILMSPAVRAKEEAKIAEKARNDAEAERQRKVTEATAKKDANVSNLNTKGKSKETPKSWDDLDSGMREIYRNIQKKTS